MDFPRIWFQLKLGRGCPPWPNKFLLDILIQIRSDLFVHGLMAHPPEDGERNLSTSSTLLECLLYGK